MILFLGSLIALIVGILMIIFGKRFINDVLFFWIRNYYNLWLRFSCCFNYCYIR